VTIAATESNESARTISRLTITIILRILLFYVLSVLLMVAIVPWAEMQPGLSPFATALDRVGIPYAATTMNVIVLTAVCRASIRESMSRHACCSRWRATAVPCRLW